MIEHYNKQTLKLIRRIIYFSDELRFIKSDKKYVYIKINVFININPKYRITMSISNNLKNRKGWLFFTSDDFKIVLESEEYKTTLKDLNDGSITKRD